jgi:hypothetical protein
MPSWLREVGVSLHLGHSGDLCPTQSTQSVRHQDSYTPSPIFKKNRIQSRMHCDPEEAGEGVLQDECAAAGDQDGVQLSFGSSNPGRSDSDGNPIITVIDRSGVHEIGVRWCCCPEAPGRDMQLMMAGLFPATFRNPKTAFTFRVLEEFHLDNLECKTTPSQFFSRLRRLTNDEFPNTVPVRSVDIFAGNILTRRLRIDIGSC